MVGRQIKDYKYFSEERGENEQLWYYSVNEINGIYPVNEIKKIRSKRKAPGSESGGSTNRGHQPMTGGQDTARLGSSDLTNKLHVCQLEKLERRTIVDRIERHPDDKRSSDFAISNTFIFSVGRIVDDEERLSNDVFGFDVHMI